MNHLPQWDGIDHIGRLAESVHTIPAQREFWLKGFRHFLVGMVAAATQEEVVNHLCLLLCSKQNLGKTTFINKILSNDLRTGLSQYRHHLRRQQGRPLPHGGIYAHQLSMSSRV